MVKIREYDDPYAMMWFVEMYHYGADSYHPGLYPASAETHLFLPPWDPNMVLTEGHALWTPTQMPYSIWSNTYRAFDEFRYDEGLVEWVSNEDAAWSFFYEMLGNPYRMISRCRYCFPAGHRYLTI